MNDTIGLYDEETQKIESSVFEVPVGGYSSFPYRLIASKLNKKISDEPQNGCGMKLETNSKPKKEKLYSRIQKSVNATNMLTYDSYNAESVTYMINRIEKENRHRGKDVFITTIAHPKCMSDAHIFNMKKSIMKLQKNKNIRFVNMQDIAYIKNL